MLEMLENENHHRQCREVPISEVWEDIIGIFKVARVLRNTSQGGDCWVYVLYSGLTELVQWVNQ